VEESLALFRRIGVRGGEAWALNHYAAALNAAGDLRRALAAYRDALHLTRETRQPDDEARALEGLGECHLSTGETATAAAHLHQALEIFQRLGIAPDADRVQTRLAELAHAQQAIFSQAGPQTRPQEPAEAP
jgi:tetratricopeptide (TPR) repeat protein